MHYFHICILVIRIAGLLISRKINIKVKDIILSWFTFQIWYITHVFLFTKGFHSWTFQIQHIYLICLFILGCAGLSSCRAGAVLCWVAWASIGVAPHCREGGSRTRNQQLWCTGSVALAACGISPAQESNLCPLRWQVNSQPLVHQGICQLQLTCKRVETEFAVDTK